jgi:hypothetical protein
MNYEEAGIAHMLVGMVRAREVLDQEIEELRKRLDLARKGGSALDAVREAKARGARGPWAGKTAEERSAIIKARWTKKKAKETGTRGDQVSAQRAYWAKMTPAERKAEMQRRTEVRNKRWEAEANWEKLHPRDPRSPKHAAWIKKMRKVSKAKWDGMTPAERQARSEQMRAGKHLNGAAA